jgi:UrcA family protein
MLTESRLDFSDELSAEIRRATLPEKTGALVRLLRILSGSSSADTSCDPLQPEEEDSLMTKHTGALGMTCLTAATSVIWAFSPAFAQQSGGQIEEIVVTAPWAVTREVVNRTPRGDRTELISLSRRVYYGDLDLAKHADVMMLENRVMDIAKDSCDHLAKMYPLSGRNDAPNCVEKAVASAKQQMDKVVAAAGKVQK